MERIEISEQELSRLDPQGCLHYCRSLEAGNILYFPTTPFSLSRQDRDFLLGREQSSGRHHKNIAFRPMQNRVTGMADSDPETRARLLEVMRRYSKAVTKFATCLLAPYAKGWRLDYASFRPEEEQGRPMRVRARNDLLHVDSFPTRPTNGDRILRVFTNLNPEQSRNWVVTEPFSTLVEGLTGPGRFPLPKADSAPVKAWKRTLRLLRSVGAPVVMRPPYDEFMLGFHHYLKENELFQRSCPRRQWEFPPDSTWVVFTDSVPHAVLSGRFALEQTFIVSRHSMLSPELAPVNILERMTGSILTVAQD